MPQNNMLHHEETIEIPIDDEIEIESEAMKFCRRISNAKSAELKELLKNNQFFIQFFSLIKDDALVRDIFESTAAFEAIAEYMRNELGAHESSYSIKTISRGLRIGRMWGSIKEYNLADLLNFDAILAEYSLPTVQIITKALEYFIPAMKSIFIPILEGLSTPILVAISSVSQEEAFNDVLNNNIKSVRDIFAILQLNSVSEENAIIIFNTLYSRLDANKHGQLDIDMLEIKLLSQLSSQHKKELFAYRDKKDAMSEQYKYFQNILLNNSLLISELEQNALVDNVLNKGLLISLIAALDADTQEKLAHQMHQSGKEPLLLDLLKEFSDNETKFILTARQLETGKRPADDDASHQEQRKKQRADGHINNSVFASMNGQANDSKQTSYDLPSPPTP